MAKGDLYVTRRAPRRVVIALGVSILFVGLFSALWLGPHGVFEMWLHRTGGLVHPNLVRGLFALALEWLLVVVLIGGFAPREVGLRLGNLPAGIGYTLALWMGAQLCAIAGTLLDGGSPRMVEVWRFEAGAPLGKFLGQAFGLALAHEVVFRGFVLAHCMLFFERRLARGGPPVALVMSAALYAFAQLPELALSGTYDSFLAGLAGQGVLVFWGLVYGLVYVCSRNVFFVTGLHALREAPTSFFEWPFEAAFLSPDALMTVAGVVVALCWGRLPGVTRRRRYEWL